MAPKSLVQLRQVGRGRRSGDSWGNCESRYPNRNRNRRWTIRHVKQISALCIWALVGKMTLMEWKMMTLLEQHFNDDDILIYMGMLLALMCSNSIFQMYLLQVMSIGRKRVQMLNVVMLVPFGI